MKNKTLIVYKLTDDKMQTKGGCQWEMGKTKSTNGEGDLCGPGWLHWYEDPLLAMMHNPVHAKFLAPRLFTARAAGKIKRNGSMKAGSTWLTLTKEVPLPQITAEARVYYAILCARAVIGSTCPAWSKWADDYLMGKPGAAVEAAEAAEAAAAAELCDVLAALFAGPRPRVVISVSGGCAEVERCPRGVEVIIKDYDNCSECGGIDCNGGHDALKVHGKLTGGGQ